ncbi:MAG: RsmB/NOP family class I SAM-dependent RNA methyltransferase, partial [Lautropia sp.]|nr:RsmB/NOP family class I SAM-dependent RNA methyltransferase [Lautropia sp.]
DQDQQSVASGLPALEVRLRRLVLLSEACRLQAALAAGAVSVAGNAGAGPCEGGAGAEVLCGLAQVYLDWLRGQPLAVRYSLPDWLWAGLCQTHGEEEAERLAAVLLRPAAIEIRVNLLKGKPAVLQRKLAEEGMTASAVADAPNALRLAGRPALARSPRFAEGWFELQDAGSQRIVETCAARRGERVIDFCAGAGGKTLALAARMRNQGQILAFDTDAARLDRLGPRLARAGVSIVTSLRLDGSEDARLARYQRWADLVLVDAPCSGSGTFRRHPDLKWRLRPEDVSRYQAVQREILQAAVKLLRPGGRLVYATCSLLGEENQQQTAWFSQWLAGQGGKAAQLAETSSRYWLPDGEGGDAFFMSEWRSPR